MIENTQQPNSAFDGVTDISYDVTILSSQQGPGAGKVETGLLLSLFSALSAVSRYINSVSGVGVQHYKLWWRVVGVQHYKLC